MILIDFNNLVTELANKYGYNCSKVSITMDTLWGKDYDATIYDCNNEDRVPIASATEATPADCLQALEIELKEYELIKQREEMNVNNYNKKYEA